MATIAALPSTLRDKLGSLARRIRLLRALRGTSLLLLVLLFMGGAALLADHFLTLPVLALRVTLGILVASGLVVTAFGLVVPISRRLDPEALAAIIEERYPQLGERLTTTVELADSRDDYHGSASLIGLLMKETEAHTSALDFTQAFPTRTTAQLVMAAGAALVLAVVPGLIWPDRYSELGGRLFLSWLPQENSEQQGTGPAAPTYTVHAERGSVYTLKDQALLLTARFTRPNKAVALPAGCELVCTAADNEVTRFPMSALPGDSMRFSFQLAKVGADFTYRIEAGDKRSESQHVAVVNVIMGIVPPAYAGKKYVPRPTLQFSTIKVALSCSRPAATASLELIGQKGQVKQRLPMMLTKEGREARIDMPALVIGDFDCMAILEDGSSPASVLSLRPLKIWADEPPVFEQVSWKDDPKINAIVATNAGGKIVERKGGAKDAPPISEAPAGQTIPLDVLVTDKVGLGDLGIEYRTADSSAVQVERIAQVAGSLEARAQHVFSLAGKVKEGGTILYRIRATDNRRVPQGQFKDADGKPAPAHELSPNITYFPQRKGHDRWFALTVNPRASRLGQQELAQVRKLRELEVEEGGRSLEDQLRRIQEKLEQERSNLQSFRADTSDEAKLSKAQARELGQLQKANEKNKGALHELADKTETKPDFQPIAEQARDIADKEMKRSEDSLGKAAKRRATASERTQEMGKAEEELARAIRRVARMRKETQALARAKLDQMKLENVARRQEELAARAAELAAKDPVKDSKVQEGIQRLQREQDTVAKELKRLTEESEPLKKALDAARADDARKLAEEARALAEAQRANDPVTNNPALAELARKQKELAEKAEELAQKTRQAARTANTQPLRAEEAGRAAEALKKGDAVDAVGRQEQAARELERVGRDLQHAADVAKDPREAARQLARLQESLHKRLSEELKIRGDNRAKHERLKNLQQEQEAIHRAAEALSIPENKREAAQDRKVAADRAAKAAEALKRQVPQYASPLMNQAKQALEQLANRLPSLQQRRQQALQEVAQLKRQQDEIARGTEEALKQAEKKDGKSPKAQEELTRRLVVAARGQAEIAERLSKLDPADRETRHEKTERAVNRALEDLLDKRTADLSASQQRAQRELDRLQQALAGQKPVDEKARELAKRQQELAALAKEAAENSKASPEVSREIQQKQQKLAQEVRNLPRTEAPKRQAEAREAARKAEEASNAKPTSSQAQKRMERAATALERLARQLNGEETRAARAERLAQRQAEAAAQAERMAKAGATGQQQAEAQRRQQEIADEAKQVRGGDEAQAEKQKAMEALAKAQQLASAPEQAKARRKAADALRDLADRLAGRKDPVAKAADLARRQREMAAEAAQGDPRRPDKARAEQAADRQADLARQLKRLNAKGTDEAAKQAAEKMNVAQKALSKAKDPAEAKDQLAKAAEAAEKLARQLARANPHQTANNTPTEHTTAKPASQSPREQAQELGRRQEQLARATQQAENQLKNLKGEQAKKALERAMQRLGEQQHEVSRKTSPLPANQNQKTLEHARQAMNRAEQAIAKSNLAEARKNQEEAARALQQLARQLPMQTAAPKPAAPREQTANPQGLPSKEQAHQAQQLAKDQRALQAEVQKTLAKANRPSGQPQTNAELARRQQEIARKTDELARNVAQQTGAQAKPTQQARQAARSTQETAKQIKEGALPSAQLKGQEAAQQLRNLAKQMQQAPEGAAPKAGAARAEQLAGQQENLNRQLQQAQEQSLQQKAGELGKKFARLGQEAARNPAAKNNAFQAAQLTQQAQGQMQQSQNQAKQGNQGQAKQAADQAAGQLDRAAQQAEQAAMELAKASGQPNGGQPKEGQSPEGQPKPKEGQQGEKSGPEAGQKAGEGVKQAQGQISQAQNKLGQGQTQSAQLSMKQAADSLQKAAEQLAKQGKASGKPQQNPISGEKGADGTGKPEASPLARGLEKYGGKRWGDLPGKLRTQILQDMKAKYGDDYARIIKLYFEQIADTKKKK